MKKSLISCVRKDWKECVRSGRIFLFFGMSVGLAFLIMGVTFLFSDIPEFLYQELPGIDIASLTDVIVSLYPKNLRESIGVYAYYIGFFYVLVVTIALHGILVSEEKRGTWILPLQMGYRKCDIVLSKCLTYGAASAVSVFAGYLFYYLFAGCFMERNMGFGHALLLGALHGIDMGIVVAYVLLLSLLFPVPALSAVSVIATVIFLPDLLNYFSFGRHLPTYLLTFVYESNDRFSQIVGPMILNLLILFLIWILTKAKIER